MSEEKTMPDEEIVEYRPEVKAEDERAQGDEGAQEERKHVVTFPRPYRFERVEYTEVDLSGLERLTVKDAIEIQAQLFNRGEAAASMVTELTTAFMMAVAARASGLPVEFFQLMKKPFYEPVFRYVKGYLIGGEKSGESHVVGLMSLEKPYLFQGKEYREIDLSGVGDMTAMQECAAENRMTMEGVMVTETSFNYLYACIVASMATGLPEAFFTGLPIRETVNLRKKVTSGGFFE